MSWSVHTEKTPTSLSLLLNIIIAVQVALAVVQGGRAWLQQIEETLKPLSVLSTTLPRTGQFGDHYDSPPVLRASE